MNLYKLHSEPTKLLKYKELHNIIDEEIIISALSDINNISAEDWDDIFYKLEKFVLKHGRNRNIEQAILYTDNAEFMAQFANYILNTRWYDAEYAIAQDAEALDAYTEHFGIDKHELI